MSTQDEDTIYVQCESCGFIGEFARVRPPNYCAGCGRRINGYVEMGGAETMDEARAVIRRERIKVVE